MPDADEAVGTGADEAVGTDDAGMDAPVVEPPDLLDATAGMAPQPVQSPPPPMAPDLDDDPLDRLDAPQSPMPFPVRPAVMDGLVDDDLLRAPTPPPITRNAQPTFPPGGLPWGQESPALEALRERSDEIVRPNTPLTQYVRNQEHGSDGPAFIPDKPFGEEKFYGAQFTPFLLGDDGPAVDMEDTDTDGIPTGLPNLLDLKADLSLPPPQPVFPPSATLPPLERVWIAATEEPSPLRVADGDELEEAIARGRFLAAGGFVLGAVVASAVWAAATLL